MTKKHGITRLALSLVAFSVFGLGFLWLNSRPAALVAVSGIVGSTLWDVWALKSQRGTDPLLNG